MILVYTSRPNEWEKISKGLAHKYIRKYRKNGKWVYVYAKGDRHGNHTVAGHHLEVHDHHIHDGASFSLGSGKGHVVINKVSGDNVTFTVDTTGVQRSTTIAEFKAAVAPAHQTAALSHAYKGLSSRQDILNRAKQYGTQKQIARAENELKRWKQLNQKYLGPEPAPKSVSNRSSTAKPETAKQLEQKDLDAIASAPDGWKQHLRDKGVDPEHPYLVEHASKAQHMWDTWGIALEPPQHPAHSEAEHQKLWDALNQDLEFFTAGIDMQALRARVAKEGLSFSLEADFPARNGSKPRGRYWKSKKKIEITFSEKAQHTFLHEYTHAIDCITTGCDSHKNSQLKAHIDALPEAYLPTKLTPKQKAYFQSDVEKTARAMEHFLPALGLQGATLEGQPGHYSMSQMREHANTFAGIAKELGMTINPELLKHFKNEAVYNQSVEIKDALRFGPTTQAMLTKQPGHEWMQIAQTYLQRGQPNHAFAAIEKAKNAYKGKRNPWATTYYAAKEHVDLRTKAARQARKEVQLQ